MNFNLLKAIGSRVDRFVLILIATVTTASLLPCRGEGAIASGWIADAAIVLLFFLHGAKLWREAILQGARNWRVHLIVLLSSFVLFPVLGLSLTHLVPMAPEISTGILFLTLLPSTVQSSVALTAMARGNVAAAVCSASLSNIVGIFVTPLLVSSLMQKSAGGVDASSIRSILFQLLLPFIFGHLARPWLRATLDRYKSLIGTVDRGAILLVVYTAFSAAVVRGLWHSYSLTGLAAIVILCVALLATVLWLTAVAGRLGGFAIEDAIVIQFCGSKKSLVSGVPMASVLFDPAHVGFVILPLMIFHQMQLITCTVLARRYAERSVGAAIAVNTFSPLPE